MEIYKEKSIMPFSVLLNLVGTSNATNKDVLWKFIKKYKKNIKIKFVKAKIMNQLSYHVESKKLKKLGLTLNSAIKKDIKETLKIFKDLN